MTEPDLVQVTCPGCDCLFLVADGAAETECPESREHIVWRQCLDTLEIFPVLSSWSTWVHPNCASEHAVRLDDLAPPAPANSSVAQDGAEWGSAREVTPAPAAPSEQTDLDLLVLADRMTWIEQELTGQLAVDSQEITISSGDASGLFRRALIARLADVVDFQVTQEAEATEETTAKKPKRFRRGLTVHEGADVPVASLLLATGYGTASLRGRADADMLSAELSRYLGRYAGLAKR